MNRETLSHYGWIVIVTLILGVMLALATPFGRFIGDAANAYIHAVGGVAEENISQINNNKEKYDEDINGEFYVTDFTEGDSMEIFMVNKKYDAYSLQKNKLSPDQELQYFLCIKYTDILHRNDILQIFAYDEWKPMSEKTISYRQGLQYYLWSCLDRVDYLDECKSVCGADAASAYMEIENNATNINTYNLNIKLNSLEKDGYADIIYRIQSEYDDNTLVVTNLLYDGYRLSIDTDHGPAYCIQHRADPPTAGTTYKKMDYEVPEELAKVLAVIANNNFDAYASQFAVWSALEDYDYSQLLEVKNYNLEDYQKILELADEVDISTVEITAWQTNEYQNIVTVRKY